MPKNMKWYTVEERAPKDGEVIAFIGSDRFHGINELRSGTVEYEVDILDVDGRSTGHSFWFDEKRPVKDQLVEMVASLEPGESLRVNYFCDHYLLEPQTMYTPNDELFSILPEGY